MKLPIQVSFRHMEPMPWLEDEILDRAAELNEFFDGIMSCRVVVEMPHKHHRQGNFCQVKIDLTVPGKEIVINHEATRHTANEDMRAVMRDAFDSAKRQLEDYARTKHGFVKKHEEAPHGRIAQIFKDDGYGFIEGSDGREIYFHSNSVRDCEFQKLQVGAKVVFNEEQGENGPQASTLRVVAH